MLRLRSVGLGRTLRILSGNLLNGSAEIGPFLEQVEELRVDVLALQEVCPRSADAMVDTLSEALPYGEIDPDHDCVGMALMARHPGVVRRIPMTWGFGQVIEIEVGAGQGAGNARAVSGGGAGAGVSGAVSAARVDRAAGAGRTVEITNLHIAAPHMFVPAPGLYLRWRQWQELRGHLGESGAEVDAPAPARSTSVDSLVDSPADSANKSAPVSDEFAAPPPARVLVGDFNSTPYWPLYSRMASQFTDAAVAAAKRTGRSLRPTWGPWPGSPKLFRIDHGFVRGVEVEDFQVFEIAGSDHSALVIDLLLS
jgi:endonuclease/exonuclease/phosphatase family metal-dependent hydrolase